MTFRGSRWRTTRVFLSLTLAISVVSLNQTSAFAACAGVIVSQAVGGSENSSSTRIGSRAKVNVPSFGTSQHNVWRAVGLWKDPNNFLEAGWLLSVLDFGDQTRHPYKTWKDLGIVQSLAAPSITFAAGSTHEFKVHDQNGDQQWSFAYDSISMGNQAMSMTQGLPVTQAERKCTTNSLSANFTVLNKINCVNCSFVAYAGLQQFVNSTAEWNFCWLSATHYKVLQAC